MKAFFRVTMITCLALMVSCSKTPEKEVIASLDEVYGKKAIAAQIQKELDSVLGPAKTKLKESLYDYVTKKTNVELSDVKINENNATVVATGTQPDNDELGGLIMLIGLSDQSKIEKMSLDEIVKEISKEAGEDISLSTMKVSKFKTTLNLKKENESWTLENKENKLFSRKNRIE